MFKSCLMAGVTLLATSPGFAETSVDLGLAKTMALRAGTLCLEPSADCPKTVLERIHEAQSELRAKVDVRQRIISESIQSVQSVRAKARQELATVSNEQIRSEALRGVDEVLMVGLTVQSSRYGEPELSGQEVIDPVLLQATVAKWSAAINNSLEETERGVLAAMQELNSLKPGLARTSLERSTVSKARSDLAPSLEAARKLANVLNARVETEIGDRLVPAALVGLDLSDCDEGAIKGEFSVPKTSAYARGIDSVVLLPLDGAFIEYLSGGGKQTPFRVKCPVDTWYRIGGQGIDINLESRSLTIHSDVSKKYDSDLGFIPSRSRTNIKYANPQVAFDSIYQEFKKAK